MANPFDDLIPDSNVAVESNPFDDIIPSQNQAVAVEENPFDDLIPSKNPFDDVDDVPSIEQPQEVRQPNIFQKKIQAIDPSGQMASDQLKEKLPTPVNSEEKAAFDAEIERRKTFEQDLKDFQSGKKPKKSDSDFNPNIKQAQMIDGIKIEAMRDEAKMNPYLSTFYSGLAALDASIARLPALAVDILVLPTNILERAVGYGPGTWSSADWLIDNPIAKYYDDAQKSYDVVKTDPKFKNENLATLVEKKDYARAGEYLAHQIIANAPNQMMIIGGAITGAGPVATLGTMGAMEASRANKENRDKEIDAITSTADALFKGGFEAIWENAGTFGIIKWGEKLFQGVGRQTGKEIVKNVFKVAFGATLGEANEEFWTSLSQDFTDKVLGIEDIPFKEFIPRALEAAAIGGLSGLSMSAPSATISGLSRANLENQIKKLNEATQKAEEIRTRELPPKVKPPEPVSIPAEQILKETPEMVRQFRTGDIVNYQGEQYQVTYAGPTGNVKIIDDSGKKKQVTQNELELITRQAETPEKPAAEKQPWEMTTQEYQNYRKKLVDDLKTRPAEGIGDVEQIGKYSAYVRAKENLPNWKRDHKEEIAVALSEGKPVPPEVLKDYPDLQKLARKEATEPTLEELSAIPVGEFEQQAEAPTLSFGEDVAEAIKPESESIARLEKRLSEISDLKQKAELAREAREELSPILELVDKRIKIPKKAEPLFEKGQAIASRFRNNVSGLPLDEILEELNNADVGVNLQTTSELREFLKNLDQRITRLDTVIREGKVPVLTMRETTEIRQRIKDIRQGIREGRIKGRGEVKSAKQILERRRDLVKGARDQFGLTDAQLRKISKKDIRLMSNYEFKKFLDDLQAKAAAEAVSRDLKNQILFQIQDKELQKVDNLRQFMKFPSLEKMTVQQLNEFNQALEETQQGDEFLSLRKLETVKNTELAGIKTVREAKEILARKLGVPLEKVSNISVSPIDKFRFDTALALRNPFYQFLVDETNASLLDSEERFLEIEREIDDLTNKARQSRKRTTVEKLIPTDELVFEFLESKAESQFDPEIDTGRTKEQVAGEMTEAELDLANYLQARFAQYRDYLIQHGTLKRYQEDYITHIRRGFLETWKQDGLLNAFKEVFRQYIEDEAVFKILEDDTQNILPLEKFFQFAMRRSGKLEPSKNVAKAFKAYTGAMLKKQALDKIVPALDIYAYSLSPKEVTPRGLEMDRRLIKFVREWVNNKKGRKTSLGGILPQGGAVDIGLRAVNGFITLLDLGLNIPVGITVQIGEQVPTFVNLGSDRYSRGIQRMNTPKGKKILSDNEAFVGKSPWRELSNTANTIGDKFNTVLFSLFDTANITANKIHLLGSLTPKEWESGQVSPERKAEIKREIGRFRNVRGAHSIFGATSAGTTLTKYKTWAIPIFRTLVLEDIPTMIRMTKSGNFDAMIKSRAFNEVLRATLTTALFVLAVKALADDDDDSFLGKVLNKAYRESLTILGAIDPTVLSSVRLASFLGDLAEALKMIVTLETYKRKPGFKGVAKLQRTLTPRAVKQFLGK